jgi:hypothetical protein
MRALWGGRKRPDRASSTRFCGDIGARYLNTEVGGTAGSQKRFDVCSRMKSEIDDGRSALHAPPRAINCNRPLSQHSRHGHRPQRAIEPYAPCSWVNILNGRRSSPKEARGDPVSRCGRYSRSPADTLVVFRRVGARRFLARLPLKGISKRFSCYESPARPVQCAQPNELAVSSFGELNIKH